MSDCGQHIAVLTNMLPPYRVPVFRALATHFDEVTIFIDTWSESDRKWPTDHADLRVVEIQGFSVPRKRALDAGRDLHLGFPVFFQLRRLRPTAVLTSEFGARTLAGLLYAKSVGVRSVLWLGLSEHTERTRGNFRILLRRIMLHMADAAVVNGRSAEKYLRSMNQNIPVFTVPQSSSIPLIAETSTLERHPDNGPRLSVKLLFVGTDAPRKNLRGLIELLKTWADSRRVPIDLAIAGLTADLPDSVGDYISITTHGFLNEAALTRAYDQADAMIFPTLEDEWGLVVNESLSRGKPVIGSVYSQAVQELIEDGVNGFLFDPLTRDGLGEALDSYITVLRSDEGRAMLRRRSLESVSKVTAERVAKTFAGALRGLEA